MKKFLVKTIKYFVKAFGYFVVFIFCNNFSGAQTCGVTANIKIMDDNYAFTYQVPFSAQSSIFQPNWVAYRYEWNLEGYIHSTINNYYGRSSLWEGYHEMSVTVYARNVITGDSCSDIAYTIFNQPGLATPNFLDYYTSFNVQQSGINTYDFIVDCYGYNPGCIVYNVDYGDGTINSQPISPYTHTYASAGNYLVTFNMDPLGFGPVSRLIHVNNGLSNLSVMPIQTTSWGSIGYSTLTTPAFAFGTMQSYPYIGLEDTIYSGGNFNLVPPSPGLYILRANLLDSTTGNAITYGAAVLGSDGFNFDTIAGRVFYDNDADGIMDTNDYGIAGKEIKAYYHYYSTFSDSNGYYKILIPHEPIVLSLMNAAPYQISFPGGSGYLHNFNSGTLHPNFNFGLTNVNVHLCGKVYIDYNQDSVYSSATDAPLKLATVHAHDSITGQDFQINVDNNGDYCIDLPAGNFTIWATTYLLDSSYCVPDSFKIDTVSGNFQNINFGFKSIQTGANLSATLYDFGNPRPGFSYSLTASVRNTGIDSTQGTIQINYNNIPLALTSLTPVGGIIDSINHTVTWTTGVMHATDVKYFSLSFMVPITTPLGTPLSSLAVVTADSGYVENNLQNNSDGEYATVVGSYDPNEKLVTPTGYNMSGGVPTNQRLYYRINFQNTGTASAINVIVQDQIDSSLDMNTFIMERASHTYKMVSNDRTVTWKFLNINLPDSNTNEPLSHGFVEYSIMPKQGLPNGVVIPNTANIYFDFNTPVATNTVTNTITDCSQLQLATLAFANTTLCKGDTLAATATLAFPMQTAWYVDGVFVGNGLTIATDTLSAGNHLIEMTALNSVCTQTISQTVFVDEPVQPTFIANGNLLTSSSATNNQWYLNGSSIAGAVQTMYIITTSGWYMVAVTDSLGCVAFSDSVWVSPVGLDEQYEQTIYVSPNPFTENLSLTLANEEGNAACKIFAVKIVDMLGKVVYSITQENPTSNIVLETTNCAAGVFELQVICNDKIFRKKIVKQ